MPSKEEYFDPKQPSPSHSHWFSWLQRQLILNGILAQTPEMPTPYEAHYNEWVAVFEQFHIDENTILIGHSLGGGFLIRWLSENSVKVGRVVLVAPWLDPNKELKTGFFDFSMDKNLADRTGDISAFISDDDDEEELTSTEILKENISGLKVKEFTGKGHFTFDDMKTEEFPELLKVILK